MRLRRLISRFLDSTVYVIGDSHCEVFNYINNEKKIKTKFIVKSVPGATALGLVNPNSKTNALKEFEIFLENINKRSRLIILIGEVDTGFLIWYRNQKLGLSIESQLNASLYNLESFIAKQKLKGFHDIVLLSVPLPSIIDNQSWGEIANARKDVKASQIERTKLTLQYNLKLKSLAERIKTGYINLDNYLLNKQTDIIKQLFLNPDPNDHHLNNEEYSKIIIDALSMNNIIHV